MKSRKGFTLIELLVVISIIALLVAILMPALNKAKMQAKSAVCLSNMKQWGVIWQMYTDANNDKFPALFMNQDTGAGNTPRGSWMYCLKKRYEKNEELLTCPAANKVDESRTGFGEAGQFFGGVKYMYSFPLNDRQLDENVGYLDYSSYGMNTWCSSDIGGVVSNGRAPKNYWLARNKIKGTADVPVFGDCKWRGGGPHFGTEDGNQGGIGLPIRPYPTSAGEADGWGAQDREMGNFAMNRHGLGINMLFADASARNVTVMELWTLKWHKSYPRYRTTLETDIMPNEDFRWISKFPAP